MGQRIESNHAAPDGGFPRQKAQQGAFTMTGRFGLDHAVAIAGLLRDDSAHVRYQLRKEVKPGELRARHRVGMGRSSQTPPEQLRSPKKFFDDPTRLPQSGYQASRYVFVR